MGSKAEQYIDGLTAKSEISFTQEAFYKELNLSYSAATRAINRLKQTRIAR